MALALFDKRTYGWLGEERNKLNQLNNLCLSIASCVPFQKSEILDCFQISLTLRNIYSLSHWSRNIELFVIMRGKHGVDLVTRGFDLLLAWLIEADLSLSKVAVSGTHCFDLGLEGDSKVVFNFLIFLNFFFNYRRY
jgi:hypothetical protein